jgi:light-regulated signal transduction histidine kinase (bacteriophytochrome)
MGDEEQIGTVFYHLIDNALTYNENAHPHIRISAVVKGDRVEWSVEDNGIGIANGHGEHIFTMFRRLHSADAYGGGVGAGLALARKIIRRHGGELNYQSENGRGAIFQFSLPVAE